LAEALASAYGNMKYGLSELAQYRNAKGQIEYAEAEAFCIDYESNTMTTQRFRVQAQREAAGQLVQLTTPRDIYEKIANEGMRRVRARILALVPADLVSAALERVRDTLTGVDKEMPLAMKVGNIVKQFGKLGVSVAHIERRLGHEMGLCLPEEYAELVEIHNSIKDGINSPSEYFDVPKGTGVGSEKAAKTDAALRKEPSKPEPVEVEA